MSRPGSSNRVLIDPTRSRAQFQPIPLGSDLATHERPVALGGIATSRPLPRPTTGQATGGEAKRAWQKRKPKSCDVPSGSVRWIVPERTSNTEGASLGPGAAMSTLVASRDAREIGPGMVLQTTRTHP